MLRSWLSWRSYIARRRTWKSTSKPLMLRKRLVPLRESLYTLKNAMDPSKLAMLTEDEVEGLRLEFLNALRSMA
ncbi:MAG: hypothetical protein LZ163_06390 [Thaumarchaeota archaeon]|nr:hypothetical protein [Candidatus Terraquivivens yellowstonensis]